LPIPIPVPKRVGTPSDAFRWAWSVIDFVPGTDALDRPPAPARTVEVLASFVQAMHEPAPPNAPVNPFRGVPLLERDERTRAGLEILATAFPAGPDPTVLTGIWNRALDARVHEGPPVWLHGDLHPGNVIVRDGAIVSVIDFGDLTSGDPATDLGAAWMFFASVDRQRFRSLLAVDEATWDRARGWALTVSLGIALNSSDNPRYETLGLRTLERTIVDC
jgi:aminoglycoside phosphotransferase (APT) family kinase protein